jgi:hypothetical protein
MLLLAMLAMLASDAVLCVETSLTRSRADTLATSILLEEALSISEESKRKEKKDLRVYGIRLRERALWQQLERSLK